MRSRRKQRSGYRTSYIHYDSQGNKIVDMRKYLKRIDRGIRVEQTDHPQLSYSQAHVIAEQELKKNPEVYD